jgi:GntR family transcriptional regulator / MocR family aminotransferase
MDLFIDPTKPRQTTRQLYDQLRDAIAGGRIGPGDRLPTSRELAVQLGVARQTITTVYGRLNAEGYTAGRAGGGTFVANQHTLRRSKTPPSLTTRPHLTPPVVPPGEATRFDLTSGTPDLSLFPVRAWQRAMNAVAHEPPAGYGHPGGLPELRRALAQHADKSRGVTGHSDQFVVTSGAQHAIDLTLRLVTAPGDRVAVEEPGYPPVHQLITALGRRIVPIAVDQNGIRPDLIPAGIAAVYTTPSHQSPTGATLSMARRRELLALADRHRFAIIEDDYDSEYRHADRPLEPLHRLDNTGRVIYVATFSKTLSPGLRLGYVLYPSGIAEAAVRLRAVSDMQPPDHLQRAMHRFIVDGELDRHLRKTRRVYSERHHLVTGFVTEQHRLGHLEPAATSHAGLHIAVRLLNGHTEQQIATSIAAEGVRLGAYHDCWHTPPDHEGIVIGFGNIPTSDLPTALAIVAGALSPPRSGGKRIRTEVRTSKAIAGQADHGHERRRAQ